eukprot:10871-Heterococcus_DN1.PRE.2
MGVRARHSPMLDKTTQVLLESALWRHAISSVSKKKKPFVIKNVVCVPQSLIWPCACIDHVALSFTVLLYSIRPHTEFCMHANRTAAVCLIIKRHCRIVAAAAAATAASCCACSNDDCATATTFVPVLPFTAAAVAAAAAAPAAAAAAVTATAGLLCSGAGTIEYAAAAVHSQYARVAEAAPVQSAVHTAAATAAAASTASAARLPAVLLLLLQLLCWCIVQRVVHTSSVAWHAAAPSNSCA